MTTPAKYVPTPEEYEQKGWLYEQYWGELRSENEIAADLPVSRSKVRTELDRHGIPRRGVGAAKGNHNPFEGFYGPRETPPAPENTQQYYDEDKQDSDQPSNLDQKARRNGMELMWQDVYGDN